MEKNRSQRRNIFCKITQRVAMLKGSVKKKQPDPIGQLANQQTDLPTVRHWRVPTLRSVFLGKVFSFSQISVEDKWHNQPTWIIVNEVNYSVAREKLFKTRDGIEVFKLQTVQDSSSFLLILLFLLLILVFLQFKTLPPPSPSSFEREKKREM